MNTLFLRERQIDPGDKHDLKEVEVFLNDQGLSLEPALEVTLAFYDSHEMVGTGSLSRNVLKCVAVDPRFQGEGLAARIITRLTQEAFDRGTTHLFVYTGVSNKLIFEEMGFYKIGSVPNQVVLMENRFNGLDNYLQKIQASVTENASRIGSIVMNCNPFTLGHQFLIETAAREMDRLHLFIVWEDRSSFPAEDRYQMVLDGTAHLSNVQVHQGKDYIISNATFPTYFLKDAAQATHIHCRLDLDLFGGKIAPALGIRYRFVGAEPYCQVTQMYNQTMKEVLPAYGVEVIVIPRLEEENGWISASKVRQALREGNEKSVTAMVPPSTLSYFRSEAGKKVILQLKESEGRH